MRKYQFVVGVSLSALEEEVNRLVNDEPSLKLIQVIYAAGTGFVGIVEHSEGVGAPQQEPPERSVEPPKSRKPPERPAEPAKSRKPPERPVEPAKSRKLPKKS